MHLLLPFALSSGPESQRVLRDLSLPNLQALLPLLQPGATHDGAPHSPALPHERVLAQALGWPDAQPLPWAARHAATLGLPTQDTPYAFITPCHWDIGTAEVQMRDPQHLNLPEEESRRLLEAIQPYALEDGIAISYDQPLRWLARGEAFRDLHSASVPRVIGQDLAPWMPASAVLRRLQNEMQMLLYTHPVNDARTARRAVPVNSFWISGSGVLPEAASPTTTPPVLVEHLSAPALSQDWAAWAQGWQDIDATHLAELLRLQRSGHTDVQLTLCSDSRSVTFLSGGSDRSIGSRWRQAWRTWHASQRKHGLDAL